MECQVKDMMLAVRGQGSLKILINTWTLDFFRDNNLDTKYLSPLQKQLLELKKKRGKGIPPSK